MVSSVFRIGEGAKALCLFTNNHLTLGVGEIMYSPVLYNLIFVEQSDVKFSGLL